MRRRLAWSAALAIGLVAHAAELSVVRPNGERATVAIAALDAGIGLTSQAVPDDFMYEVDKTFRGYDLGAFMAALKLPADADYLFVCDDGYEALVGAELLNDGRVRGFVARADADAPGGDAWLPLPAGNEQITLAPLYLTWRSTELGADALKRLPWPYGLREIRAVDAATRVAGLKPPSAAPAAVRQGFAAYRYECVKCHQLRGAGGTVGPDLSLSAMVRFFDHGTLAEVIGNFQRYYPNSKMPDYAVEQPELDMPAVASYLKFMAAPRAPTPGATPSAPPAGQP